MDNALISPQTWLRNPYVTILVKNNWNSTGVPSHYRQPHGEFLGGKNKSIMRKIRNYSQDQTSHKPH